MIDCEQFFVAGSKRAPILFINSGFASVLFGLLKIDEAGMLPIVLVAELTYLRNLLLCVCIFYRNMECSPCGCRFGKFCQYASLALF